MKKTVALMLALFMCVGIMLTSLVACNDSGDETGSGTSSAPTQETDPPVQDKPIEPGTNVSYTVKVQSQGGLAMGKMVLYLYNDGTPVEYLETDEFGTATISLPYGEKYYIVIRDNGLPEGYSNTAEKYSFGTKTHMDIVLTSKVIEDTDISDVTYTLGSVMHDFSVTTTEGTTFTLSEVLKTKKAVLINFWYAQCGPCVNEFPYMQDAYELHSEDIGIIALNHTDSEADIKAFKEEHGLTFDVALDTTGIGGMSGALPNWQGYPTTLVVDRYGVICLIEVGGLTSEKPFIAAFEHFSAENYQQKLLTHIGELTPVQKPNIPEEDIPTSEEYKEALGGSVDATYYPDKKEEYSWPFITAEKDGEVCIKASNSRKDSSFATLFIDVEMKAGEALALDWFASTEKGADILYVLVDDKDVLQISGDSNENEGDNKWKTCYPFVALEDGTYTVALLYMKDSGTDTGEDTVYLKNFRKITDLTQITTPTYIPRFCATDPDEYGIAYQNYSTVVYNEEDGYYHVGTANGPLVLVNLMGYTRFNEENTLNLMGYNGELVEGDVDYYEILVNYCNYSINSEMYGYCPVNEELRGLLIKAAQLTGSDEVADELEWLEACLYYDIYGTTEQLGDPIKGLANFSAFDAYLSTGDEVIKNEVNYNRAPIMPRGFKYKFTPTVSGAYRIQSFSEYEVNGWIFNEAGEIIKTYSNTERFNTEEELNNCDFYIYLEAGENYYIDIAFYDIYGIGSFYFTINYLGEDYKFFHAVADGPFSYIENEDGTQGAMTALGIDVVLGDDGYYYELRPDGSRGSKIYADFIYTTFGFTSQSITELIERGAFDFSKSENDQYVLTCIKNAQANGVTLEEYLESVWEDGTYEENYALYQVADVLNGKYHGEVLATVNGVLQKIPGTDRTEEIKQYLEDVIVSEDETNGCVAVTKELAELLQLLMDKFTFEGVENSWLKVCYYYENIDALSAANY